MTARSRCDTCQHPGRAHRVVTGNKKPCDCVCHQLPPERRRHRLDGRTWREFPAEAQR